MENNLVEFSASVYKKTELLFESFFKEKGNVPKARSKAIKSVKDGLESTVIKEGGVTTHGGFFALIYQADTKKPWAIIAYRPSFNYDLINHPKQMEAYLAINAPGMKL